MRQFHRIIQMILVAFLLLGAAHARIGESRDECLVRYGEPKEIDQDEHVGEILRFSQGYFNITCVIQEGRCKMINYQKSRNLTEKEQKRHLSDDFLLKALLQKTILHIQPEEQERLLKENSAGRSWKAITAEDMSAIFPPIAHRAVQADPLSKRALINRGHHRLGAEGGYIAIWDEMPRMFAPGDQDGNCTHNLFIASVEEFATFLRSGSVPFTMDPDLNDELMKEGKAYLYGLGYDRTDLRPKQRSHSGNSGLIDLLDREYLNLSKKQDIREMRMDAFVALVNEQMPDDSSWRLEVDGDSLGLRVSGLLDSDLIESLIRIMASSRNFHCIVTDGKVVLKRGFDAPWEEKKQDTMPFGFKSGKPRAMSLPPGMQSRR